MYVKKARQHTKQTTKRSKSSKKVRCGSACLICYGFSDHIQTIPTIKKQSGGRAGRGHRPYIGTVRKRSRRGYLVNHYRVTTKRPKTSRKLVSSLIRQKTLHKCKEHFQTTSSIKRNMHERTAKRHNTYAKRISNHMPEGTVRRRESVTKMVCGVIQSKKQ